MILKTLLILNIIFIILFKYIFDVFKGTQNQYI